MWVEDYQWHYDYVRLAWDTGFSFEKFKSPSLDKNKICVVDVDRIVKERDVASVDRYISTVVQYALDDEQAKILDINFVKIFRISQLAVEYLLFCKKYLDNTVVLLKKELSQNREENKELKIFIEDLQTHVDTLTRQHHANFAAFKCTSCSKVFASEEYLMAHVKRRHSASTSESNHLETDKLNLEIKELKERLNNTEKLLQDKDAQSPARKLVETNNDNGKMLELLEKFEKFKCQVEDELKELKVQKSFYEQNYGKLFELLIQNKENVEPNENLVRAEVLKAEITTQTDKVLQIENVHNKNIVEVQEQTTFSADNDQNEDTKPQRESPKKRSKSLEEKITSTLAGIEDQMQAFWYKLSEIEEQKMPKPSDELIEIVQNKPEATEDPNPLTEVKPTVRPRSKLTQPTQNTSKAGNNTQKLQKAINELEHMQRIDEEVKTCQLPVVTSVRISDEAKTTNDKSHKLQKRETVDVSYSEESESVESSEEASETESSSDDSVEKMKNLEVDKEKKKGSPYHNLHETKSDQGIIKETREKKLPQRPHTSGQRDLQNFRKAPSKKTIAILHEEIEERVFSRLQELGISENWKQLPEKSFKRALEIINHQATLTKKSYPKFESIKKKIDAEIEKQCKTKTSPNKSMLELKHTSPKTKRIQNIVKVGYRTKPQNRNIEQNSLVYTPSPKRETIQIKNRLLYDTDSDSDINPKHTTPPAKSKALNSKQWYSNVVEELKSHPNVKLLTEVKSVPNVKAATDEESVDEINKDGQKGVLKNYPSVGSLSKKKVLFDLESESSKIEDAPVVQKTGGSTTSIASSILGEKVDSSKHGDKERANSKIVEKDFDDLSDFDLSEL